MVPPEDPAACDAAPEAPPDVEALERKFQRELSAGLVALVLLAIMEQAGDELYGYQIAKQLQRDDSRVALIKQGALYPVLRTLSANGLLASRVEASLSGPPRRYYRITPAGREVLARWAGIWRDTRDFVDRFAEPGATPPAITPAA